MDFPSIIKDVREKLGISQENLARSLNVSFATINRWENGKTKPNKMVLGVFNDFCIKHRLNPYNGGESCDATR